MFIPDSLAKADGHLPDNLIIKVLEEAANSIMITDPGGQILWVNRAMQKLTGYAPNELIGKNPRILKSGKNPPQIYQDLWNTILAGNYWQGELINRKKDGSNYKQFDVLKGMEKIAGKPPVIENYDPLKEKCAYLQNQNIE